MFKFSDEIAREKRRMFSIRAYNGENGAGKSLLAVHDLLPSIEQGRPILSTLRLIDPVTGGDHPLWVPFKEWRDLLEFRDGDVLMDEVQGVASAREWNSMPPQVFTYLQKLRKRDVTLSWTTPDYSMADKGIRDVTQLLTMCVGHMPVRDKNRKYASRLWPENRYVKSKSYRARQFETFTVAKGKKLKTVVRGTYAREKNEAQSFYETLGEVTSLGWAFQGGLCLVCGGKRVVPRCTCLESSKGALSRPTPRVEAIGNGGSVVGVDLVSGEILVDLQDLEGGS